MVLFYMTDSTMKKRDTIPKSKFLAECSSNSGIDIDVLTESYEAITNEIVNQVNNGRDVKLAGFGRFWLQKHKQHNRNFGAKSPNDAPDYYVTLKYTASALVKNKLDDR